MPRPREYYFYNRSEDWSEDIYSGYSRAIWDIMSLIIEEFDTNNQEISSLLKEINKIDNIVEQAQMKILSQNKEANHENL